MADGFTRTAPGATDLFVVFVVEATDAKWSAFETGLVLFVAVVMRRLLLLVVVLTELTDGGLRFELIEPVGVMLAGAVGALTDAVIGQAGSILLIVTSMAKSVLFEKYVFQVWRSL